MPKEGEKKKKFAVCVKGLDFPSEDISVRLVEWIEMLNILGADKVSKRGENRPKLTTFTMYVVNRPCNCCSHCSRH